MNVIVKTGDRTFRQAIYVYVAPKSGKDGDENENNNTAGVLEGLVFGAAGSWVLGIIIVIILLISVILLRRSVRKSEKTATYMGGMYDRPYNGGRIETYPQEYPQRRKDYYGY